MATAPSDPVEPETVAALPPTFPIVGIGASAGGLEALDELFAHMPLDTGMAFVVVTHQHPGHASLLRELLGRITALPVQLAADGVRIEPNHVYVSSPGGHLAILNGTLQRMDAERKAAPHLPIDSFLRSLAADQKERAICIILSGTGTDGTLGLKAVKGESGMAMVQAIASAKYDGMPSSALATGLADFVLPAQDMAEQLVAYAHALAPTVPPGDELPADLVQPMQKIFILLRARTGHDFSGYKGSTIRRRVERRMHLHQIRGPAQYVQYLEEHPLEIDLLFKELLISVTSFFRDPEAFESLATAALATMVASSPDDYTFRIWTAGCATGEEAFSLAILMRERLDAAKHHGQVQIFGTDLDGDAIDAARLGRYPEGISNDVTPQRLERHFTLQDGTYRIRKEIREMAVFALQNVIKDPPFTKLDLISCRNLLIYLNADLQGQLLPLFHYALKPGGLLLLGSSESIGGFGELFDVVDRKWKIFRRKPGQSVALPVTRLPTPPPVAEVTPPVAASVKLRETPVATALDRLLLVHFAPASVVVGERGDVVYIHGRTGAYLEPSAGQPRLNILEMARAGLQIPLTAALRQATAEKGEVTRKGVRIKNNGDVTYVNLSVSRIDEPERMRGLLLVSFRPGAPGRAKETPKGRALKQREVSRIEEIERDLVSTKESLQTTIEELETANEELQSAN